MPTDANIYEEEVEASGNPDYRYLRELPPWGRIPTQMIGHSIAELGPALSAMEASLPVGDHASIEFVTRSLPTEEDLAVLHAHLIANGHHATMPTSTLVRGMPVIQMTLTKGSPLFALLVPLLPLVITGGLIVFGITRLERITKALMPLILAGGGVIIMALGLLTRKHVVQEAGAVARARSR